jgi:hypothetical protein
MAKKATAKRKPARPASRRAAKKPAARKPAARKSAARKPAADDFDVVVQLGKGRVSVLFRPTNSHYLFRIAAERNAKPRAGAKPRPDVELDAGAPGAASGYVEAEIFRMSEQLASAAVKDVLV